MNQNSINSDLYNLSIKVVNNLKIETTDYNPYTNKMKVRTSFPQWFELEYDSDTQIKIREIIRPHISQLIQQKIFDHEIKKETK